MVKWAAGQRVRNGGIDDLFVCVCLVLSLCFEPEDQDLSPMGPWMRKVSSMGPWSVVF